MNSKDFWKVVLISLVVAVLVSLVIGQITGGVTRAGLKQCRDKVDNDGDGKIDYPADSGCSNRNDPTEASCVSGSTTCGIGACLRTSTCVSDSVSCTPGSPTTEVCDGIDNDCDGLRDEGGVCGNGTGNTTG